jgi:hypothetical protein
VFTLRINRIPISGLFRAICPKNQRVLKNSAVPYQGSYEDVVPIDT